MRSGISTISPRSKSDPASNGGWRVNVGLLLAEMAILLFFPLPARPQATPPDSETHGNLTFSLNPQDVNMQLFSWFIQEEIALVPDQLYPMWTTTITPGSIPYRARAWRGQLARITCFGPQFPKPTERPLRPIPEAAQTSPVFGGPRALRRWSRWWAILTLTMKE